MVRRVRADRERQSMAIGDAAMAKKEKMLEDLFHETLKDIYYAEKKILTALPKMAKAAQSEDLQAAFEKHEGETKDQVGRLEQIFELIRQPARGKTCDAINGMIDESQEVMKEFKGCAALDAGLLASAQAVEHYDTASVMRLPPPPARVAAAPRTIATENANLSKLAFLSPGPFGSSRRPSDECC
jgi:ferritin-like metal-binding protein YciE